MNQPTATFEFLTGGGEMGERIRAHDWGSNPLGPPETWPQSLRSALSICLNSTVPTAIYWGEELRLLYNDAWAPIPTERHPWALGRPAKEVWADIWDVIEPQLNRVVSEGTGFSTFDHMLLMVRGGAPRETYWDYSFTPIRGEGGGVAGIFNQGHETTARILSERARELEAVRQRRLFRQAPGFITILRGPDHVFEFVNDAYQRLFGDREYLGKTVAEAFPELEHQGIQGLLDTVYRTGERFVADRMPVWIDHPDAGPELRRLDFIYEPVTDDDGSVTGIFCEGFDVTNAYRAETELRESEGRFRDVADAAPVLIWMSDASMGRTWFNRPWLEFTGRAMEDASADGWVEGVHPDDRSRYRESFERAFAAREALRIDYRLCRSGGDYRIIEESAVPRFADDGTFLGYIGAGIDVTESRGAEPALRESEARFRLMANAVPAIVWVIDATGRNEFFSEQWYDYTGAPRDETSAEKVSFDYVHPDDAERTLAALAEAQRTGNTFSVEHRIRSRTGEYRWFLVRGEPHRDSGDGKTLRWFGASVDIHARRQAEADLRELNETLEQRVIERTADLQQAQDALRQSQKLEAMGQLTGGVAHDFNNLLTPIIGSLDMLQRRNVGDDRTRRQIDGALQSAERAKTLVQRLLAFARRQPLHTSAVNLRSLVDGMLDLVTTTSGPQIQVMVDIPPDLPLARADANQVEMAILNLAVNSRDAMPRGGRLTISAAAEQIDHNHPTKLPPGDFVRLTVSDTGVGMDEATAARAIEPFFSTKGIGQGTGLGLSMVHGLASQLGGALTIRSRPGAGTSIDLWLARAAPAVGTPLAQETVRRSDHAGTVLLVDDQDLVRASTADMLDDLGYRVIEARRSEEALKLLDDALDPDILITDHLMPGMTGTDLARIAQQQFPALPVLVVSGYAEDAGIDPALPRLTKPFRQPDLAAILTKVTASPIPNGRAKA